jgi:hypothetical protein
MEITSSVITMSGEEEKKTEAQPRIDQDVLLAFAAISPQTAKKIRKKTDIPLFLKSQPSTKGQYERLSATIEQYNNAAKTVAKDLLRNNLIVDLLFVAVTIVLIIISAVYTDIESVTTTAGVGGVTFFAQAKNVADHIKLYNQEMTSIKLSVARLRSALSRCDRNDKACLDSVDALIQKAWDTLNRSST